MVQANRTTKSGGRMDGGDATDGDGGTDATATAPAATDAEAADGGGVDGRQVPRWMVVAVAGVALLIAALLSDFVAESLVIGATENAPFVLAALGFALLYRLTGLLNVAYAETITLGGYFGVWMNTTLGWGFLAVVLPAGILAGGLSVATYLLIFRVAKNRRVGDLEMIAMSFGLSLFLRHALQFVFGYPVRFFDIAPPRTISVLGVGVPSYRLLALASVAVLSILIYQFIQRTSYGLQIRALASNEGLAQASGIRPMTVTVLIWFVAGLSGGLAGAFYGVGASVSPLLGSRQLLLVLLVVLVGGIWDLLGVVWAGVATGIALTAMTLQFGDSLYSQLVLILCFLAVLKIRGRRLTEGTKV
ncbi:MAG: branched-chain amino acid ABC transporter permease [Actinomycetota bacterium]